MEPQTSAHDYDLFLSRIREIAAHRGYATATLGTPFEDPLVHLTPLRVRSEERPRLLVGAGFHGYEISGPWGVLHFLESAPDELLEEACIEFLPAVNPWGFRHNTRWNRWGQDPNDGYCPPLGRGLSVEGRILLSRKAELLRAARHGALMLHGDLDEDVFYLYSYEFSTHPTAFTIRLVEAAAEHFLIDPASERYGDAMKDGVVYCRHDGSFEDWLFRKGVPFVATTEVPGRADFHRRIIANAALIERFVRDAVARGVTAIAPVRPLPAEVL
jgi:predicted deacylase